MFETVTEYDKKALLVMNRTANRTFGKRKYLFQKIFHIVLGLWCLIAGGLLLLIFGKLDAGERVIAVAAPVIGLLSLLQGLFLDRLSARASRRMMIEGSRRWTLRFDGEGLSGENTDGVQSAYPYSRIQAVFETQEYFLLQIDKRHCVILDKSGFTQGTSEDFRRFISEKTGLMFRFVKI